MRTILIYSFVFLLTACAGNGNVVEEGVTDRDGVVDVCGDEPGMGECRDFRGETMNEELEFYPERTDQELDKEAELIREESPSAQEKTIPDMEGNP